MQRQLCIPQGSKQIIGERGASDVSTVADLSFRCAHKGSRQSPARTMAFGRRAANSREVERRVSRRPWTEFFFPHQAQPVLGVAARPNRNSMALPAAPTHQPGLSSTSKICLAEHISHTAPHTSFITVHTYIHGNTTLANAVRTCPRTLR
jgi:hypothetical protein